MDVRVINELVHKQSAFVEKLSAEVSKVIVGQKAMIERILIGLLTGGHVLLEGVPGLAKTLTVKTLSDALRMRFQRNQFTPDLHTITASPPRIRAESRHEIDLMPRTSSASISSLIRMAPNWAVAPAPTVAASATPATMGAAMRVFASAAKNPVNASTPMLPSDAKPWMAISELPDSVTKPMIATVPPMTAIAPVPMPISAVSRSVSLR